VAAPSSSSTDHEGRFSILGSPSTYEYTPYRVRSCSFFTFFAAVTPLPASKVNSWSGGGSVWMTVGSGEDQERFCGPRMDGVPFPFDVHTPIYI
jgi:hypothetical protein